MPRPSLIERYYAQCQVHRTAPLPAFAKGISDGVMEVNVADISLADIRLFALAVKNTTTTSATPGMDRVRCRVGEGTTAAAVVSGSASSASSTQTQPVTFFTKLHFFHDPASSRRLHSNGGRGSKRGASATPATAPPPLLAQQSESTLRCFIEAVTQVVKENTNTLKSFAWCGLPIAAPSRDLIARVNALSLTQVLPLCRHLTCLHLDGVSLTRAQFMQLSMISPSSDTNGGSWQELVEASFVNCGLTDACKGGIVRLIRAALPIKTAERWRLSLRSSNDGDSGFDDHKLGLTAAAKPSATMTSTGTPALRGLVRLDVSRNPLGDEAARAIATAITGSALQTLCLASTAITNKGAALLLLPSVLDENAIELIDLSSTQVSVAFGTAAAGAGPSASELRLLAASSIAAGFRVVARGMGQLLVLREAVRVAQQPWNVRTLTGMAARPGQQEQHQLTTRAASPVITSPQVIRRSTLSVLPEPSRGRWESEYAEDGDATPDPFGAFINTAPTPFVPSPLSARVEPIPQKQQQELPQQQQRCTQTTGAACSAQQHISAMPSSLPPSPSTKTAATANLYGPWWPTMPSWYAMQSSSFGGPGSVSCMPKTGENWVPVPVPVPVPVLTPVALPYEIAPLGSMPWAGGLFPQASTASAAPEKSGTAGSATANCQNTTKPAGHDEDGTRSLRAARAGSFLHGTTEVLGEAADDPPQHEKAAEGGSDEAGEKTVRVSSADGLISTTQSVADDGTASSTHLTREASEAAGGSKFLTSLISRLEAHETDVSERLEQQYQRTTAQLTAMEKDVRFRLQQLSEAERKERAVAADRQTALLEAVAAVKDAPVRSAAEAMSEEMLSQLVQLIEAGMKRVHAALEKEGVNKVSDKGSVINRPASLTPPNAVAAPRAMGTERDMVKEANQRLKQLGW